MTKMKMKKQVKIFKKKIMIQKKKMQNSKDL